MSSSTASSVCSSLAAEHFIVADPGLSGDLGIRSALRLLGSRPGTVHLLDRDYVLTVPIVLRSGQAIQGCGPGTRLQYVGAPSNFPAITLANYSQLCNFSLTAQRKGGVGLAPANATSQITCRDISVSGFGIGLQLDNCYTQVYDCCRFEGCETGVRFTGQWVMNCRFVGGHIAGNKVGVAIEGAGHMGHEFSVCMEGNSDAGLLVSGSLVNAEIHRCYFELNGAGDILLEGSGSSAIEIHSNLFASAMADSEHQSQVGIRVRGCCNASIANNSFGLANPLEILPGAQGTQVYPNRFGTRPDLSAVSGGYGTQYHVGSSEPPPYWFRTCD